MAYVNARTSASKAIETEHLLAGMLRENAAFVNRFLKTPFTDDPFLGAIQRGSTSDQFLTELRNSPSPKRGDETERVILRAAEEAKKAGEPDIGIDHLLIGILCEEKSAAARMLRERGADLDLIRIQLAAAPHKEPSQQERKLKTLNKMMNLLETNDSSSAEKIAQIRSRLERGDDVPDASDQLMEIMADQARAKRNPDASSGSSHRVSEKVRRLVFFAQFEAKRFGASEVETGHLLLVVLREQKDYLNLFLPLADSKDAVCAEIEESLRATQNISLSEAPDAPRPPLSEDCKRAQVYAHEEASRLFYERIGTEHLLLGLLRVDGSASSRTMRKYGAELENIRAGLAVSFGAGSANSVNRLQ